MADKLRVENLKKVYPGTVALKNLTVAFDGGKVHAIIGKNGSGKSTLIKIISGAIQPTEGTVLVDGKQVLMTCPQDAFQQGIATVYQEMSLVREVSVAENIFLGRLPKKGKGEIRIDWDETYRKARKLLKEMGIDIDVKQKTGLLSIGQQQVVEIAKAMSFEPDVLMLDEPTSALAMHEVTALFKIINNLKKKGVAILYISHRLQELNEIADTVTVLRDGEFIGKIGIKEANPKRIVEMMFGEVEQRERPSDLIPGTSNILEIKGLTSFPHFSDISFSIKKGEILGIAGMLGSGRTELLRAIFGADPFNSGEIIFEGKRIEKPSPILMKQNGIGLTPENRKEEGLVQVLSIRENLCMASWGLLTQSMRINKKLEKPLVEKQVKNLQIKAPSTEHMISSLSGGNQQKVVVGNWLNTNPELMMFDEPSRGIDVQAKQQIFQIMWDLSREGVSSLFVSTELEELLEVCHRILIMQHGKIVDEVYPENLNLERLYEMCMEA
ncbi:MAG: sugar ABC transporter ATP-binding protein [Spirochaetales bacterium]|nr:sugar ABC transporter ATP-binding protein [Spirochaetales bacterium]